MSEPMTFTVWAVWDYREIISLHATKELAERAARGIYIVEEFPVDGAVG